MIYGIIYCQECKGEISTSEAAYSERNYKRFLCYNCQQKVNSINQPKSISKIYFKH